MWCIRNYIVLVQFNTHKTASYLITFDRVLTNMCILCYFRYYTSEGFIMVPSFYNFLPLIELTHILWVFHTFWTIECQMKKCSWFCHSVSLRVFNTIVSSFLNLQIVSQVCHVIWSTLLNIFLFFVFFIQFFFYDIRGKILAQQK